MANRNRKLQVFVSSTFIDLQEERQAAVQAILKVGDIPAGMELFKAGDEEQWEIIKSWIEESDVYMLILGGRYGSIEPKSGNSYTQLEYEYALKLGKPFFAIVINDSWTDKKAKKRGVKIEDFKEVNNLQKLNDFRATVKTKMVSFADDLKDIKLAVSDSLHEINKRENLQGWVKADDTDFSSISEELARLSKENSELKEKIANLNVEEKINGIPISQFVIFLKSQKISDETKMLPLTFENDEGGKLYDIYNLLDIFWICCTDHKALKNLYFDSGNSFDYHDLEKLKNQAISDLVKFELLDENGRTTILNSSGSKLFIYLKMNPHLLTTNENY
ncbi:DUF4062 domain-containing protein [Emticicia sp. SJ17W-69]|uniref:DUF4062 domain-containing protein n=1 Tax=Emticicia sp. SJ17W-69 TaxID=3421657 RepID=UPI003EBBFB0D